MDDADDCHPLCVGDKEHHVGESTEEGASNRRSDLSVRQGNAGDSREGRIARAEEVRAESRLSLFVPSKRRVHFERGGSENREGAGRKVHSGAVELVLQDAFAHLFPTEGTLAALAEIFDTAIEFGEKLGRHRNVWRGSLDSDRVPKILDELQAFRDWQAPKRIKVRGRLAHITISRFGPRTARMVACPANEAVGKVPVEFGAR